MLKIFLYPLYFIVAVLMIGALGVASDVMQLTNFNILEFIRENSPNSLYYLGIIIIIIYIILVAIGFFRKVGRSNSSQAEGNTKISQRMKNRDISNSTINQSGRDTNSK
ncbi:hypothetical protein MKZ07_14330 [Paenibacillus sp. FSL P4-0338]|uniref:hypothetical protein n=1 Tax=Paenibacillus sp. FSL P4-0338 TaxID=2921635 RepID=UPI0030F60B78